jgi:hypothetical protein
MKFKLRFGKIIFIGLFILCLSTFFSTSVNAASSSNTIGGQFNDDNFTFTVRVKATQGKNGKVSIAKYNNSNSDKKVKIPQYVKYGNYKYTVYRIDQRAFYKSNMKAIEIPDSITSIYTQAFNECSQIKSIELPKNCILYGSGIFSRCTNLTEITLPSNLKKLPPTIFEGCKKLTNILMPPKLVEIGTASFNGCKSLVSIILPNSIEKIGGGAFSNCSSLVNISIPDKVKQLEHTTFKNCSALQSVKFSNSLKVIGASCFEGCINLSSINWNSNVTNIRSRAFYKCKSMKSISLPDSIVNLEYECFAYCSSLESLTILNKVNMDYISQDILKNANNNLTIICYPNEFIYNSLAFREYKIDFINTDLFTVNVQKQNYPYKHYEDYFNDPSKYTIAEEEFYYLHITTSLDSPVRISKLKLDYINEKGEIVSTEYYERDIDVYKEYKGILQVENNSKNLRKFDFNEIKATVIGYDSRVIGYDSNRVNHKELIECSYVNEKGNTYLSITNNGIKKISDCRLYVKAYYKNTLISAGLMNIGNIEIGTKIYNDEYSWYYLTLFYFNREFDNSEFTYEFTPLYVYY